MRDRTWLEHSEHWLRGLTPTALTLLMVFVSAVPWHLPGLAPVTPAFTVMAVFYWGIYRPDRLPYAATFAVGIFQDLVTGAPMGMTALVLLLVHGVVAAQRTFFHGKPFLVVWWGFSLVMPAAGLASWIIASAYAGTVVPPLPIVVQTVLTMLLYPILGVLFSKVQQHAMARV